MKQKIVSAYIKYLFKSNDNKYYACILVCDYEVFVEVGYFELHKKLQQSIRVVLEAYEAPVNVVIPAYKERQERTVAVLGKITKPVTRAGLAELQAMLELVK